MSIMSRFRLRPEHFLIHDHNVNLPSMSAQCSNIVTNADIDLYVLDELFNVIPAIGLMRLRLCYRSVNTGE